MTPLQISILIHYYTTPTDYRDGDFSAPAVKEQLLDLYNRRMLRYCGAGKRPLFEITDFGRENVEGVGNLETPIPPERRSSVSEIDVHTVPHSNGLEGYLSVRWIEDGVQYGVAIPAPWVKSAHWMADPTATPKLKQSSD